MSEVASTAQNLLEVDWKEITLGDVAEFVMGQAPPGSECNKKGNGTLFVKAGEFGELYPVEKEWTTKPLKHGQDGDVFICVVGATSGKLNLGRDCAIGRSVAAIRPNEGIDTKYIYYQLQPWVMKLRVASTGSAQGVISKAQLKDVPFKLADEATQQCIVAEIDKQFSRLDEAVTGLKRVKANLKRYKAAVLKAAVEGKLTEEWRKQNPDVEPASKLLERILAERRTKWEEAELAKMKAKGKEPKNDKWKEKYKEPAVKSDCLVDVPDSWSTASVDQVSKVVQYGSSSKTAEDICGVPVLRMGNIFEGHLDLKKLKYLPVDHPEFPELLLQEDDFLFNRTNSPELVGKTAVYKGSPSPCSFASYLIRVKCLSGISPAFVSSYLESMYGRLWVKSVVNQQVGQANVNGTKLKALVVPLPPQSEQHQIVEKLDDCCSGINRLLFDVRGGPICLDS
jgi:type I restriction enzyme S subunit